jgi:hypothetical protein
MYFINSVVHHVRLFFFASSAVGDENLILLDVAGEASIIPCLVEV